MSAAHGTCSMCHHTDGDGISESGIPYRPLAEYRGVLLCRACRHGVIALETFDGYRFNPRTQRWTKP